MKKIMTVWMVIAAIGYGYAQPQQVDSLKKLLLTAKEDTAKADILLMMGRYLIASKPDSALPVLQQGLALSKKLSYLAGEANGLNLTGLVFSVKGNYPKALSLYLEALKINEQRNDRLGMAKNLGNISSVFADQADYRQCINYLLRAKALLESIHAEEVLATAITNLGVNYFNFNMPDSAKIYTNQAYHLSIRLNDTYHIATSSDMLGSIFYKMNRPDSAMMYKQKAAKCYREVNEDDMRAGTLLGIAEIFKDTKQADSSLYYARQAFSIASKGGFPSVILNASKFLAGRFKDDGKLDSAFHFQELYIAAKDSLFSEEKVKQVQVLAFAEQQRQEEIAAQKRLEEAENRKNLQLAGIAVFLPVFFVFALYLSRTQIRLRTVDFLCTVILLLVFEFISMLIRPLVAYMEHFANDTVAINMLIHIGVASLLVPVRNPIDRWVKSKLLYRRQTHPAPPAGTAPGD